MSKTVNRLSLFLAIIFLILLFGVLALYFFYQEPLKSALNGNNRLNYLKELIIPRREGKVIYGFLPYWNIKDFSLQPELTHLAYFSLTIAADGSIISREGNYAEPGYNNFNSDNFLEIANRARLQETQLELVLSQFDNDDITDLLSDDQAQLNLINSIDAILLAYPVSGINIDIEYSGEVNQELKDNYLQLIRRVSQHLNQKYDNVTLSIDVYASAASNENTIWDIQKIETEVDYIIVMAYDFHSRLSAQAGPVAPLFSEGDSWSKDINQQLKKFLDIVDRRKLLLGIPFYGYGWQTESTEPNANTFKGSGFTVSYKSIQQILGINQNRGEWQSVEVITKGWDANALSPYISYQQEGKNYLVYYEDQESIAYKIEYAKQLNLAGIAIWALGYEGQDRELWSIIDEKL